MAYSQPYLLGWYKDPNWGHLFVKGLKRKEKKDRNEWTPKDPDGHEKIPCRGHLKDPMLIQDMKLLF